MHTRGVDSAAGLTAAGLNGLHVAAQRHAADDKVPGLVALVARGGQMHVEALGTLAVGGPPVARDSIFRIAGAPVSVVPGMVR